jgi:DNA-binding transcriptional LysR family regulator
MFAWDDLRFVLAIARSGNLAAAADALGVNHSTMFRRLNALEAQIGAKLFERLPHGYRPTDSGQRFIEAAERMETEALALDRDLTGRDARLSGMLRVTVSETSAYRLLPTELAQFRAAHPGIVIELTVENRMIDLSRREADVAMRATRPTQGDLFGRKLSDIRWALYATPGYLKAHSAPAHTDDLARHALIGWTETAGTRAAAWIARHAPAEACGYRSNSIVNQMMAAKTGMGIAVLPRYLAEPEKDLTRLKLAPEGLLNELWLATHASLKDTARIRSFMEIVGEGVKRRIAMLEVAPETRSR